MPLRKRPVFFVTPNATDAEIAAGFLQDAGIDVHACGTLAELCRADLTEVGCAVLVEEALVQAEVQDFLGVLSQQPAWSDLPLVVVASEGAALTTLIERVFPASGNVALLERPLSPVSLVSAVRVGLRARSRQMEVRVLLQERADALRGRDEFLAMLAHELRNPLAPLRNAVYLMKQPGADAALLDKMRDLIDRQTSHLKRMVDDLLDVSRLELGKVTLQIQPLDLNTAAAAAVEACSPATASRGHTVAIHLSREPLMIEADPVRIEQVIANLVANAAKFTPEGGHISLIAADEDGMAVVKVRDNGVGIRPDMIGKVFELFAQDATTLERSSGGLGIGLTIVKRLVELHGGNVDVLSDGLGRGAQFTVRFPPSRSRPVSTSSKSTPTGPARRILVVDDNRDIRDSLGLILRMWGHEVTFAETGTEGLRRAHELEPDIALIDIGLPELDGYGVARGIRGLPGPWSGRVRLIALTGYGRDSDREQALSAGFDFHLVKPIDPEVLATTLQGG